jgi:hypothetical protein
MARGHPHGSYDTSCFQCDGVIKDWNASAAVNKQSTELIAYCSYCFERSVHTLLERPLLARHIYECAGCKRKTLKCLNCDQAMCQADGVLYANSKCALCLGEIKFWEDTLLNKQASQARGWCSWCFEFATHDFDEQMGTTGLVRKVYRCQECKARTLECLTCKIGMCQGTEVWDEKTCAGCAGVAWEEVKQLKDTAFNRPRTADLIRLQLSRPSEWRAKAYERGMLRPFLLLVSMSPRVRFQVGISLGWSMIKELDEFGEVHAEAYDILYHAHKGMEARCEEFWETLNPTKQVGKTWYELLHRISSTICDGCDMPAYEYCEALSKCLLNDPSLGRMEANFMLLVGDLQRAKMTAEQVSEADGTLDTLRQQLVLQQLAGYGISAAEVRFTIDSAITSQTPESAAADAVDPSASNAEAGSPTAGASSRSVSEGEVAVVPARGVDLMTPVSARSGEMIIHQLQRDLGANDPFVAVLKRSIGGSAAFKTILGASAVLGLAGVVAPVLFVVGTAWWTVDLASAGFGKSLEIMLPAVVTLQQHKLVLALHGLSLDHFDGLKYGAKLQPAHAVAPMPQVSDSAAARASVFKITDEPDEPE